MNLMGLCGGQYRPLTPEQIAAIHDASLTILENIGMTYEAGLDDVIDQLAKAGAGVDAARSRVIFPRELVMEQVARAPSQVMLYSRDGRNDLDLSGHRVYLGTGGAAIRILDLDTGTMRPTTLEDLGRIGRLVDQLDNIHFFLRPCIPTDIPAAHTDANVFYTALKATAKHVMAGVNDEAGLQKALGLAALVAGDLDTLRQRPFVSIITSFAISPLKFCTQSTRIMQAAVREGIPVALSSAPMAGSTAPLTMAGTLAQLHAEELAGITLCQLTRPGAAVLYGGIPGMADLSTMGYLGGAVECGMMNAAIHQLAHHVQVPNYNSAGLSDAKLPDAQAGWEKAMTILLAAMGGSNFIHHAAGMLESMLTVAYEQYVLDDEIIGAALKVLKGIDVTPEHLALEVISRVGPGGNFMVEDHTMEHLRSEYFWGSGITDRRMRDVWAADGAKDARTRAREKARTILARQPKTYITADIDRQIRHRFKILESSNG